MWELSVWRQLKILDECELMSGVPARSRPYELPSAPEYLGESAVLRQPDTSPQPELPQPPLCGSLCAVLGVKGTKMNQAFV